MQRNQPFPRSRRLDLLRCLIVIPFALLLLLLAGGGALADGSGAGQALHLTGQAVVVQGREQEQLLLSATASDGSGWRLDLVLTPRGIQQRGFGSGQGGPVIVLAGTYELSGPGVALTTGQATGQVTQQGDGQVQLGSTAAGAALKTNLTPLVATFTVHDAGQLNLDLSGTLPAPVATTAANQSSQPVDHTFWYISRAAGFSAYVLLTLAVCLGLMVRTRFLEALLARWRSFDLHQVTALVALAFVGLHIFSLLGDHYVGFQFDELFVPLTAPYRPVQVAIGIIATYLLIVVVGSFYVRRSISYQTWRAIHYATFGIFLLALGHGVLSGTDTGQPWATAVYWITGVLVGVLTLWRIQHGSNQKRQQGRPVAAKPRQSAEALR